MKAFISTILSIFLLLSSSGITYAQHYCGEFKMMETITIGEAHLSCGMVMQESACGDEHATDHDCCDNEYTSVTTDDSFAKASFDIEFSQPYLVTEIVMTLLQPEVLPEQVTVYTKYNPPPLIKDIPVLYETFLI